MVRHRLLLVNLAAGSSHLKIDLPRVLNRGVVPDLFDFERGLLDESVRKFVLLGNLRDHVLHLLPLLGVLLGLVDKGRGLDDFFPAVDLILEEVAQVGEVLGIVGVLEQAADLAFLLLLEVAHERVVSGLGQVPFLRVRRPEGLVRKSNHLLVVYAVDSLHAVALELNGERRSQPDLPHREVQAHRLLLIKSIVVGEVLHFLQELGGLEGLAAAHLGHGLHIYGHLVFALALLLGQLLQVLRVEKGPELLLVGAHLRGVGAHIRKVLWLALLLFFGGVEAELRGVGDLQLLSVEGAEVE